MKRITTGAIDSGGGNVHIGDIHYKSLEYKELQKNISLYEKLIILSESEEDKQKYRSELRIIEVKLQNFKRGVIELADTFSHIEINTERLKLAKEQFDMGMYSAAKSILISDEILDDQDKLLQRRSELEKKWSSNELDLRRNADEFLILANLAVFDFNQEDRFERCKLYFDRSLSSNKNSENLFNYAYFLQVHNQISKATELYEEALETISPSEDNHRDRVATIYLHMGVIQHEQENLEAAEKLYEQAIKLFRELEQIHHDTEFDGLSTTLGNLGNLKLKQHDFVRTESLYKEVLDRRRRKLASRKTSQRLADLGHSYNNLGNLYFYHDKNNSKKYLNEALTIFRELRDSDGLAYAQFLGNVLINLGEMYKNEGEFESAENSFKDAHDIFIELKDINPEVFLPSYAELLTSIGRFQLSKKELGAAKVSFKKALKLFLNLSNEESNSFSDETISLLIALSTVYAASNVNKEIITILIDSALLRVIRSGKSPKMSEHLSSLLRLVDEIGLDRSAYLEKHPDELKFHIEVELLP